tara:strand:- start:2494 stop:2682 length:189 start_codon:yes stop_codon:yes gene_type:complete
MFSSIIDITSFVMGEEEFGCTPTSRIISPPIFSPRLLRSCLFEYNTNWEINTESLIKKYTAV